MKISHAKISVVTPSFNQGQYIEETIQSVLAQNYDNFEHFIIDGGSTDNTMEVIEKYEHLKWVSEPDLGQSDALNKGFRKASNEWILWLNADDILLPGALTTYSEKIIQNQNADVIHGHMQFFKDGSNDIFKKQFFNHFSRISTVFGTVIPPTTGTMFKTQILLENPLDVNYHYMMDAEWFMRCGKKINVLRINDFLVKFRISSTNKTSVQFLTRKLNEQEQKEKKILFKTYAIQYLKYVPMPFHNCGFNIIKTILLNWNRIQKVKYYLRLNKKNLHKVPG